MPFSEQKGRKLLLFWKILSGLMSIATTFFF